MKKLSLGLAGFVLGAMIAACSVSNDGTTAGENDELNENKALGMTDVTILYPMPDKWELVDDMLGPPSEDAKGELLPASLFAKIADLKAPPMIQNDGSVVDQNKKLFEKWADNFAYLRVVGIRLDPCFGETTNLGAQSCLSTIRLVAQFFMPRVQANTSQPVLDASASVHLFYKLTQNEFATLAKEMLELRKTTGLPLQKALLNGPQDGVHPTLKAEGLRGAYANALKAIILKYAGEQTLSRIAFCVQDRVNAQTGGYYQQPQQNPDTRWVFGGFEHRNGQLLPLQIGSFNNYTGLESVDAFPSKRGDKNPVTVEPAIAVPDNILGAFNPMGANGQFDAADIEKGKKAARRLQNPGNWTSANADCVSCHMSKLALLGRDGMEPNELDFKSYSFRLDHSPPAFGPFKHFGWDQGRPVISARTVNETAVVLEYLNKNVLR